MLARWGQEIGERVVRPFVEALWAKTPGLADMFMAELWPWVCRGPYTAEALRAILDGGLFMAAYYDFTDAMTNPDGSPAMPRWEAALGRKKVQSAVDAKIAMVLPHAATLQVVALPPAAPTFPQAGALPSATVGPVADAAAPQPLAMGSSKHPRY